MRPSHEQCNAFLSNKPLPGVAFVHNAPVRVIGGEHTDFSGSIISVEELGEDPIYLVKLLRSVDVGAADAGKRQADTMGTVSKPTTEFDVTIAFD